MDSERQSNVVSSATISFANFETVSEAYVSLTAQLKTLLEKADFSNIKRSCVEQINTPSGAQLPSILIETIKKCNDVTELFDILACSVYWNWYDVRLLKAMAAASGLPRATELIDSYKKAIFSRKLIDLLPNSPNKDIKEKYYTKIVAKLKKDDEITVADLFNSQSQLEKVLLDIKNGTCILDHVEGGCIEVHWYIPTSCVDRAYETASARCSRFKVLQLQYLKIGNYPVIHDPLSLPDVSAPAPIPPAKVGKL